MALVNKAFSVSVTPGMMPPIVHVSEYDIGRAYTVSILDEQGNTFTIPSGTTASIEGTLNGSVGFTQSATVSNNQVSFTLSQSMTAYSGKAWCKIKLTQNSQPIQTCAFILDVDRAGVDADTVIQSSGLQDQVNQGVAELFGVSNPPSPSDSGKSLVVKNGSWDVDYTLVSLYYVNGCFFINNTDPALTADQIVNNIYKNTSYGNALIFVHDISGNIYELKFAGKKSNVNTVVFRRLDGAKETTLTITGSSTSVAEETVNKSSIYHVESGTIKDSDNNAVTGADIAARMNASGIPPIAFDISNNCFLLSSVHQDRIVFTLANAIYMTVAMDSSTPDIGD